MHLFRYFTLAVALTLAPMAHAQSSEVSMGEIALFLTVKTQPGQRDALIALWEKHLQTRAAESADQTRYVIARDLSDPDVVRITEVYATQAAFEANSQAPFFAAYMAEAGPLLAGQPEFHMAQPHWVK